jgi:hypothetical protein
MSYQMLSEVSEESLLPLVLPAGWRRIMESPGPAYTCWDGPQRGVMVLVSAGVEEDGREWLHVSASRAHRTPSWEDMDAIKRLFVGDDRFAYQVMPKRAEHYSLNVGGARGGNVLHLWCPLDGVQRLPDFLRARGGTL